MAFPCEQHLLVTGSMEPPADGIKIYQFNCNFARLSLITKEVYDFLCFSDLSMREHLPLEFLDYYVTALLWARLLHIKRYTCAKEVTKKEDDYIRYFQGKVHTLPEPIYKYLMMIGHISNLLPGWKLCLSNHKLPTAGCAGYHGTKILQYNHFRFTEIPSLGVSGDCIMYLASMGSLTEPPFPFLPEGTEATLNMVGYFGSASPLTTPVSQALESFSITADEFKEDIIGTRLNFGLMEYVANIIHRSSTFKLFLFSISQMSIEGSETQLIQTHPTSSPNPNSPHQTWTQISVQPQVYGHNNPECVKASYYAGFQLYKEAIGNSHLNWCCVKSRSSSSVRTMQNQWALTRNIRRKENDNFWKMHHITFGDTRSQYNATREYVWNMICSKNLSEHFSFRSVNYQCFRDGGCS